MAIEAVQSNQGAVSNSTDTTRSIPENASGSQSSANAGDSMAQATNQMVFIMLKMEVDKIMNKSKEITNKMVEESGE